MAKTKGKPAKASKSTKPAKVEKETKKVTKTVKAAPAVVASKYEVYSGDSERPALTRNMPSPYPFATMDVNDRFFVDVEIDTSRYDADEAAKAIREEQKRIANRLTGAGRRFNKRSNSDFKFSVRPWVNPTNDKPTVAVFRDE